MKPRMMLFDQPDPEAAEPEDEQRHPRLARAVMATPAISGSLRKAGPGRNGRAQQLGQIAGGDGDLRPESTASS